MTALSGFTVVAPLHEVGRRTLAAGMLSGARKTKAPPEGGASSVTSPKGNTFTHINSATNTQIKSVAGTFHSITINTTAAGAVTIVDTSVANCTGGTTIAVFAASATIGTYTYDVGFTNGLCITTAAASDITVSAR
jgi:hypothetical protein